jgi:hypothetical protein
MALAATVRAAVARVDPAVPVVQLRFRATELPTLKCVEQMPRGDLLGSLEHIEHGRDGPASAFSTV